MYHESQLLDYQARRADNTSTQPFSYRSVSPFAEIFCLTFHFIYIPSHMRFTPTIPYVTRSHIYSTLPHLFYYLIFIHDESIPSTSVVVHPTLRYVTQAPLLTILLTIYLARSAR